MAHQVLARKWRPQNFAHFVGQEAVVQALKNALDQQRLHHAYLFTGTRGVGKTTIARILAKCLNCEQGVSATPCEQCHTCQEINQNHCVDLIEIDAASHTKVEGIRELLNNVPYAPTRARYKVYVIDEVHMLSTHSFNALLKTLEEPPAHVIFILATTDPERLPITVLSRCLQFHLKNMSAEQITEHLQYILQQENIAFEIPALKQLAHAAAGSMRDALSLLDQAITYSNQTITEADIHALFGTVSTQYFYDLLDALIQKNADKLIDITQTLATQGCDFYAALETLVSLLHRLSLIKFLPTHASHQAEEYSTLKILAHSLSHETIQLYYQISLTGRRDLPLAPTPQIGFEMVLLRLLAFEKHAPAPVTDRQPTSPVATNDWATWLPKLNLPGATLALARHCTLKTMTDTHIELVVEPQASAMLNPNQERILQQALSEFLQKSIQIKITVETCAAPTPAQLAQTAQQQRQLVAQQAIMQDKNVQILVENFSADLQTESIRSIE